MLHTLMRLTFAGAAMLSLVGVSCGPSEEELNRLIDQRAQTIVAAAPTLTPAPTVTPVTPAPTTTPQFTATRRRLCPPSRRRQRLHPKSFLHRFLPPRLGRLALRFLRPPLSLPLRRYLRPDQHPDQPVRLHLRLQLPTGAKGWKPILSGLARLKVPAPGSSSRILRISLIGI